GGAGVVHVAEAGTVRRSVVMVRCELSPTDVGVLHEMASGVPHTQAMATGAANRTSRQPGCAATRLHQFRRVFNEERLHEALEGCTPASLYRPSPRSYTGVLIEYPGHFIVKRVTNAGTIRFKKRFSSSRTR